MGSSSNPLLIDLGLDLAPVKDAARVITATMEDLNRLTTKVEANAKSAVTAQKPILEDVRATAQATVKAALDALLGQQKLTEASAKQTAELRGQIDSLKLQTAELLKHVEIQDRITATLREQVSEARKMRVESGGEGGRGLGTKISEAVLGTSVGGKVGSAIITGAGIGAILEAGTEGLVKFIEKIKEASLESDKLVHVWDLFQKASAGQGTNADDMLARLRDATGGLVNKLDLATYGAKILQSGVKSLNPERIEELTRATVELAEANGHSAKEAVDTLTLAFSRGARNAGFMLSRITGIPREALQLQNIAPIANQAQRATESLEHSIVVVIAQAEQLKPVPQTLEQSIARIKVLLTDAFQSFGKGLNESGGVQYFISWTRELVKNFGSLENVAEKIGRRIGDMFGVIIFAAQAAKVPLEAFEQVFRDIINSLADFMSPAEKVDGKVGSISDKFKNLHPVMSELIKLIGVAAIEMTKLAGSIELVGAHLKEIFAVSGLAGILGAIVGGLTLGPGGIIAGFSAGAAAGGLVHGGYAASGALDTGAPGLGSAHGTRQFADKFSFMSKAATQPLTPEGRIALLMNSILASINSTDQTQASGNPYKAAELDQKNLVTQRQLEEAQAKFYQAQEDAQTASAKAVLAGKQKEIADAKALDEQSYRDGEESLQKHLDTQRGLEVESYKARLGELAVAHNDTIKKLQDQQEDITNKVKRGELTPAAGAYQVLTVQVAQASANEENQRQLEDAARQHQAALTQIVTDGDKVRLEAQKRNIQEEQSVQLSANKFAQQANEKALQNAQITASAFLLEQRRLIESETTIKKIAAIKTYLASPNSAMALAAMNAALAAADEEAAGQTGAAKDNAPSVVLEDIKRRYAPVVALGTAQYDYQRQYPVGGSQSNTAAEIIGQLQQQKAELVASLDSSKGSLQVYNETLQTIQSITAELAKWKQNLEDSLNILIPIAGILGTVGTSIGTSFRSKYGQNISAALTGGTKAYNPRLAGILSAGIPTSHPGFYQDATGETSAATSTPMDIIGAVAQKMSALGQAVDQVVSTMLNAKNSLAGALGGATGGGGLGSSIGSALGTGIPGLFKGLGASAGPLGALAGTVLGGVFGAITGNKNQQVTNSINQMNQTFTNLMNAFANNTNNLQATISQLQALMQEAITLQANSKKGSAQYQQLITQYASQITQLTTQQEQTIRQMNEQVAILAEPVGAQQYLSTLQQILQQYQQFAGAANSAQQLATANQFLTQSLQQYEQNLSSTLLQDNQQAIQDALQLNELTLQRQQMVLAYNQQVQSVLSAGVLTRQMTRAQSAGTQIEQMNITYQQQLDQINQQIAATTYRVTAESQIFNLAQTRIGLENQLTATQNAQVALDMQRISALQAVVAQIASSNFGIGALGALLNSMQTVTTVGGGATTILQILESLFVPGGASTNTSLGSQLLDTAAASAYQSRAGLGFAQFRGQNI